VLPVYSSAGAGRAYACRRASNAPGGVHASARRRVRGFFRPFLHDTFSNSPSPLRRGEGGSPTALSPAGAGRVRGPFRPFLHDTFSD
jgi:hypothetical protein